MPHLLLPKSGRCSCAIAMQAMQLLRCTTVHEHMLRTFALQVQRLVDPNQGEEVRSQRMGLTPDWIIQVWHSGVSYQLIHICPCGVCISSEQSMELTLCAGGCI